MHLINAVRYVEGVVDVRDRVSFPPGDMPNTVGLHLTRLAGHPKGVSEMSRVAVIGEQARIHGFALAGVVTHAAETDEETRSAWHSLGDDVAVVILTPRAADRLAGQLQLRPEVLTVVMPS